MQRDSIFPQSTFASATSLTASPKLLVSALSTIVTAPMEAQQTQPTTNVGPPQEPTGTTSGTAAPTQHQQPPQAGNMAGQGALPVEGAPMNPMHMGQPAQPHPVFSGQGGGFLNGAPSQDTFNGNGAFHMPNMIVPPQQMMAGTSANGATPEHAVNGNAISAGKT